MMEGSAFYNDTELDSGNVVILSIEEKIVRAAVVECYTTGGASVESGGNSVHHLSSQVIEAECYYIVIGIISGERNHTAIAHSISD